MAENLTPTPEEMGVKIEADFVSNPKMAVDAGLLGERDEASQALDGYQIFVKNTKDKSLVREEVSDQLRKNLQDTNQKISENYVEKGLQQLEKQIQKEKNSGGEIGILLGLEGVKEKLIKVFEGKEENKKIENGIADLGKLIKAANEAEKNLDKIDKETLSFLRNKVQEFGLFLELKNDALRQDLSFIRSSLIQNSGIEPRFFMDSAYRQSLTEELRQNLTEKISTKYKTAISSLSASEEGRLAKVSEKNLSLNEEAKLVGFLLRATKITEDRTRGLVEEKIIDNFKKEEEKTEEKKDQNRQKLSEENSEQEKKEAKKSEEKVEEKKEKEKKLDARVKEKLKKAEELLGISRDYEKESSLPDDYTWSMFGGLDKELDDPSLSDEARREKQEKINTWRKKDIGVAKKIADLFDKYSLKEIQETKIFLKEASQFYPENSEITGTLSKLESLESELRRLFLKKINLEGLSQYANFSHNDPKIVDSLDGKIKSFFENIQNSVLSFLPNESAIVSNNIADLLDFVTDEARNYYESSKVSYRSKEYLQNIFGTDARIEPGTMGILQRDVESLLDSVYNRGDLMRTESTSLEAVMKSMTLGKMEMFEKNLTEFLNGYKKETDLDKNGIKGVAKSLVEFFGISDKILSEYHETDAIDVKIPSNTDVFSLLKFFEKKYRKLGKDTALINELMVEVRRNFNEYKNSHKGMDSVESVVDLMFDMAGYGIYSRKVLNTGTGTITSEKAFFNGEGAGIFGDPEFGVLAWNKNVDFNNHPAIAMDYENYDVETMRNLSGDNSKLGKVQLVEAEIFRIISNPKNSEEKKFTANSALFFSRDSMDEVTSYIFDNLNKPEFSEIAERFKYDSVEMQSFFKKMIILKCARDNIGAKAGDVYYGRDMAARKSDLGGIDLLTHFVSEMIYQEAKGRKRGITNAFQIFSLKQIFENMLIKPEQESLVETETLFDSLNPGRKEVDSAVEEKIDQEMINYFLSKGDTSMAESLKEILVQDKSVGVSAEKKNSQYLKNIRTISTIDLEDQNKGNGKRLQNGWNDIFRMQAKADLDMMTLYEAFSAQVDLNEFKYSFKGIFDTYPPHDDLMNQTKVKNGEGSAYADYYKGKGALLDLIKEGSKIIKPEDFDIGSDPEAVSAYFSSLTTKYSILLGYSGIPDKNSRKNNVNEIALSILNIQIMKVILAATSKIRERYRYPNKDLQVDFIDTVNRIKRGLIAGAENVGEKEGDALSNALKDVYFNNIDSRLLKFDIEIDKTGQTQQHHFLMPPPEKDPWKGKMLNTLNPRPSSDAFQKEFLTAIVAPARPDLLSDTFSNNGSFITPNDPLFSAKVRLLRGQGMSFALNSEEIK